MEAVHRRIDLVLKVNFLFLMILGVLVDEQNLNSLGDLKKEGDTVVVLDMFLVFS